MGSAVSVTCKCGFHIEHLPIGGGINSHKYLCSFPCLCKGCGQFTVANLLEKSDSGERTPRCRWCKSENVVTYDEDELCKTKGPNVVAGWNLAEAGKQLSLTDGEYFCPTCKQYTLTFKDSGLIWD